MLALLRHSDFASGKALPSPFLEAAHDRLVAVVQHSEPRFPCFYARVALNHDDFWFCELPDYRDVTALGATLSTFLTLKPEGHKRSVLAVFERSLADETSLAAHERGFWEIIQGLHNRDATPWPERIPTDPSDQRWAFCFDGTPVFINGHSSRYQKRRSRSSPAGLMFILQRLDNLDGIVGLTPYALEVRERIRGDLQVYDQMPSAPDLGVEPASPVWDWKQFWLPDSDEPRQLGPCPITIRPRVVS